MEIKIEVENRKDYQEEIRKGIRQFNSEKNKAGYFSQTRPEGYGETFGFYAIKDEQLIGGIIANKKMQWIDVEIVFIDKQYRGQGIASQLINRMETYCKENDLVGIHLCTLDFQAKGFYEKLNFELIAEIKNWPRNHTRYEFIKYVNE